jgi:trehalose/maltose hydrolase-like predicted phosphorylase
MGLPAWPPELRRSFDAILFDWDGTAVPGRSVPALDQAEAIGRLLDRGVLMAVVAGTHSGHIEQQLLENLDRTRLGNLNLLMNRGSEVYGFDDEGRMIRQYRREASARELKGLDQSIDRLRGLVEREFGISTAIISDRLNRRKLDLIPDPQWGDPPKARISELLQAVEQRLGRRERAIPWIMGRALELALEAGIREPRITTDVKHIEIGLTDKSDSARWFVDHVVKPRTLDPSAIVILGDEFGAPPGLAGSDALMRIPELADSVAVSVGVEPAGVPGGVRHHPGGPSAFLDFLDLQLANRDWGLSRDPNWCVEQEAFDPGREREMETLFSVGNGLLGVRGALEVGLPGAQADVFIAGIYDGKASLLPYSELEFLAPERDESPHAEIVSFPFPLRLEIRLDGQSIALREDQEQEVGRTLDLGSGILSVRQRFRHRDRWVDLRSLRVASLENPHALLHEVEFRVAGNPGNLEFEVGTDFSDFHLRHPHLLLVHPADEPPWSPRGNQGFSEIVLMETRRSRFLAGVAVHTEIDGRECTGRGWSMPVKDGQVVRMRRTLRWLNSRDPVFDGKNPSAEEFLEMLVRQAPAAPFEQFHSMIGSHRRSWRRFWSVADIPFSGNAGLSESQRFNAYHLRSAAPQCSYTSIPARTLTGRGYEGHIFWDAEVFMLPFFALQSPQFARRILEYRYLTLDGARRRAAAMGCRGACFAWESTVDGDDVTPAKILLRSSGTEIPIYTGSQQIHVTADVAYGIWMYWYCTSDLGFMLEQGVEMLFETARFWSSRTTLEDGRYHIDGVVGPDEYHHGVRDNAYTNWMARFNLEKALWARDWLLEVDPKRSQEITARLQLFEEEFLHWSMVARQLHVPSPDKNGLIEQFEGFFALEEFPLQHHDRLKAPVRRLLDWKRVNRSRICKQADVLMLPFLFPERFSLEVIRANYHYYEPITDHGSSLSPPVHAAVAAMAGLSEHALRYYSQSVELDLFNLMRNTSLGVHAACMAGSWRALVFGILGIRLGEEGPEAPPVRPPSLPPEWGRVSCSFLFRGREKKIEVPAA